MVDQQCAATVQAPPRQVHLLLFRHSLAWASRFAFESSLLPLGRPGKEGQQLGGSQDIRHHSRRASYGSRYIRTLEVPPHIPLIFQ